MADVFKDLIIKGIYSGQVPAREAKAREWYRKKARENKSIKETTLLKSDPERLQTKVTPGQMYFFLYDAKHKQTLPYWDRFPLIFPFRKAKGGFYGINMHYLPLSYRAQLMDALYDITNNKKFDETTKLKLNYNVLQSAAKFRFFEPCVKHYLNDHVKSSFMLVQPVEWDIALWLPVERFQGASKTKVWADSKKRIGK